MGNEERLEEFRKLLEVTPNMVVNGRGMMEFTCFRCKPNVTFPDIDQHMMHDEEIHLSATSYKNLLMKFVGPVQSIRMGLSVKTEKEVINLLRSFDALTARRYR